VRLAQQQAQLTGSLLSRCWQPSRVPKCNVIVRAAQPRLTPFAAWHSQRDVARIKATAQADTAILAGQARRAGLALADDLPIANAVAISRRNEGLHEAQSPRRPSASWWMRLVVCLVRDEVRNLVRVSRIEDPGCSTAVARPVLLLA
jgi:hypothetical protein